MNKDVLVSVSGIQLTIDGENPVEIISRGQYYKKNGKSYIKYQEISEDNEVTECMIKVDGSRLEITKKGNSRSCMLFELDRNCMTPYETPFGTLMMGITTSDLIVLEDDDALVIKVRYSLDINYQFVSECTVDIKVISQVE